ncbi:MAG: hypothetical protein ACI865_000835 [Flavobacteriaceae bacterium]|jgi:hypothetical protein
MNEDYLQLIWDRARLPMPELKLTDGTELTVKRTGDHNVQLSGPDFFNACIAYDDLEFHGAVEIHVNSSDWYKHKHHLDDAFNSVVLHVVYNDDSPVQQNGHYIPTLELKGYLDKDDILTSMQLPSLNATFPCRHFATSIDSVYWESMKTKALHQKLGLKVRPTKNLCDEQALYLLIAASFGMGVNQKPFVELAKSITWDQLSCLSPDQRIQLILVTSGWMSNNYTHGHGTDVQWHFRGTRPSNFPSNRLPQFAAFVGNFEMSAWMDQLSHSNFADNFQKLCREFFDGKRSILVSERLIQSILINAFVPFLWRMSERQFNEHAYARALRILENLPAEKNGIINKWRKLGVEVKNALDTQGLLALNRYYCSDKKCLSCEIGVKGLEQ